MSEWFYNFHIEGKNRGYSYLCHETHFLYSFTRFRMSGEEVFTNVFELKLDGSHVLACRHGDGAWIDLTSLSPNHLPSCAYPLLLPKVRQEPLHYIQVSDEDGSVYGEAVMKRSNDEIQEFVKGQLSRQFTLRDEICVAIDWGSAVSYLCRDGREAAEGSGIPFTRGQAVSQFRENQ